jgi:hypothetical protein
MFDTNAINKIVKQGIDTTRLDQSHQYFISSVQLSELNQTKEPAMKEKLIYGFKMIENSVSLSTTNIESAPWGGFPWGGAPWGANGGYYKKIKERLSTFKKKRKDRGNSSDALIIETCLIQKLVLVSDDFEVQEVSSDLEVECVTVTDFLKKCGL